MKSDINNELYKALKEILNSPNITECPSGRWSTADSVEYQKIRRAEAALDKADLVQSAS